MTLGEKLRYLRSVEGTLRGLEREMTQAEVARAIHRELKQSISQAYLSQIESGVRPHMTPLSPIHNRPDQFFVSMTCTPVGPITM